MSLHRFPKDDSMCRKWAEALGRPAGWLPIESDRVCSSHFDPAVISRCRRSVRLLECAVPRQAVFDAAETETTTDKTSDHTYALPSAQVLKRRNDVLVEKIEEQQTKLTNTKKRETRLRCSMEVVLGNLKEQHMLSQEAQIKLEAYSDIPADLFNRPMKEYTEEQKDFALTLHMQSGKAYEFVRNAGIRLPHQRTLAKWMASIDDKPGFSIPMLNTLAERCKEDPAQYQNCTLALDGMSIKQQVTFTQASGDMMGFEDLGDGEEGEMEAKEALVFMLIGVRGHWKAPFAYFLTKGVRAEGQKQLLLHALAMLADRHISVLTVVMDGHGTNVGMCGLLGGRFRQNGSGAIQTSFRDPNTAKEIFLMFDACHMLKLIRNMLHHCKCVKSPDGTVCWKYITMLHELQEQDGLRLANRLTGSHIDFDNCKMRVSTAAQTLSRYVYPLTHIVLYCIVLCCVVEPFMEWINPWVTRSPWITRGVGENFKEICGAERIWGKYFELLYLIIEYKIYFELLSSLQFRITLLACCAGL